MVINKRISFLASLLKGYNKVIDIGSDHGLVLKEAFDKGYIKEAIATDLRKGPLLNAKENLSQYDVKFYQADGFNGIKDSFDACLISGMGVYTIIDILKNAPLRDKDFFLQANDKIDVLRELLMEIGFMIIDEYYCYDKHHYIIIKAKSGKMELSREDIILGPFLKKKPEALNYYLYKLKQISKIIEKVDVNKQKELKKIEIVYKNVINV